MHPASNGLTNNRFDFVFAVSALPEPALAGLLLMALPFVQWVSARQYDR